MTVPSSMFTPKVTPLPLSQVRRQLLESFCCWCAINGQQDYADLAFRDNMAPKGKDWIQDNQDILKILKENLQTT